ncbi:MAG: rRNA maturation RNase YbeY [Candidatus Eremiobacteraeota bacterium]|nr:rRNA maturation RNase YbeY [Candidatus Eremiobacteraeota bacterium]
MIHYRNDVRGSGVDSRALKRVMNALLAAVGEERSDISIALVNDAAIQAINRQFRSKDAPTDVLSFPMFDDAANDVQTGERLLGDIVISVDTARRQACEYDAPLQRELYRLLLHGLLHIMGHDHMKDEERVRMEAEERRLAAAIDLPWPYEL